MGMILWKGACVRACVCVCVSYYYAGKVGYTTLSPDLQKFWPRHNFKLYLLLLITCLTVTCIFQRQGAISDRKDWVKTVETRVGPRVGYPFHWSDLTKALTHTPPINILLPYLPHLPCPNANTTLHQRKPYPYLHAYLSLPMCQMGRWYDPIWVWLVYERYG